MGQITVNGQSIPVDDSFFKLSPEEQDATVDEIAQELGGATPQVLPEVAEAEQYMRGRGKELQRQEDVAQYAARPPLMRAVQDVSDIFNVAGRSAATLATGAASLVSPGEYKSITPEHVIARLRTGQTAGPEFDAEVEKQKRIGEAARNRLGWAAPVAETLPMMALPVAKIFQAGKPLLNLAVTGGAAGMAQAAGSEQDPLLGAAGGLLGAPIGAGIGKGIGYAAEKGLGLLGKALPVGPLKVPPIVPAPTQAELKQLSSKAFKEADNHGIIFNKQGLTNLRKNVQDVLDEHVYDPGNEEGVMPFIKRLDDYVATGNATFEGLRSLRRLAANGYRFQNKNNNAIVSKVIDRIDKMVETMNPQHMAANTTNPQAAAEAARRARSLYARGAKLETVQNLIKRGELQGETNISKNVRQAVRKQLVKIIDPSRPMGRGFSAAEKAAVEKATKTTRTQDVAHALSGLMPRDKLSTAVHAAPLITGLAMGGLNPTGAALALGGTVVRMGIGAAAERAANRMAQKSVDELVDMIASGGIPKQAAQSVLQKLTASKRQAVMQGLGRVGFGLGAVAAQPLNEAYRQNE